MYQPCGGYSPPTQPGYMPNPPAGWTPDHPGAHPYPQPSTPYYCGYAETSYHQGFYQVNQGIYSYQGNGTDQVLTWYPVCQASNGQYQQTIPVQNVQAIQQVHPNPSGARNFMSGAFPDFGKVDRRPRISEDGELYLQNGPEFSTQFGNFSRYHSCNKFGFCNSFEIELKEANVPAEYHYELLWDSLVCGGIDGWDEARIFIDRILKKGGKTTYAALKVEFEHFMIDFFDDLYYQFGKEFLNPLITL